MERNPDNSELPDDQEREAVGEYRDRMSERFSGEVGDTLAAARSLHERSPESRGRLLMMGTKVRELLDDRKEWENSPEEMDFLELLEGRKKVFGARMNLWQERLLMAKAGTRMVDVDYEMMEQEIAEANNALVEKEQGLEYDDMDITERPEVRAMNAFNKWTLDEYGLFFDKQMLKTVDRLAMNVAEGKPTLLVGERGIAKTNVAKFLVKMMNPELSPAKAIISVHGDMTSEAFAGRMKYDQENKAWYFDPSKMVKAMDGGYPIILDEINTGDQNMMMAIQDWLLLRPGKGLESEVHQDENGTVTHRAKGGFAVIATMNDYRNRQELDAATRDRFENNILEIRYSDVDPSEERPLSAVPKNLLMLAMAAGCDEEGRLSKHIEEFELEKLCKLAMLTERAMTLPVKGLSKEETQSLVENDKRATSTLMMESAPTMSDCVTPRTLVSVVQGVARGTGKTLRDEVLRTVGALRGSLNQEKARLLWGLLGE